MYEVGSCILLRQTILPHLNYRNIPLDDTYLWDREFRAKYGLNINQWLLENNIKLEPHFILKVIKRKGRNKYRIVNTAGKEKTICEQEILIKGEPHFNNDSFDSWNLLSIVEKGAEDANPLPPHPQDWKPMAQYIEGTWYGLAHEPNGQFPASNRNQNPKKEMQMLSPSISWDKIPEKNLIVGLPWCDAWKPRISESRTGIGYHVVVPTEDIRYAGSIFRNRQAEEKTTYQKDGKSHFYIPINRLQPYFGFPERNKSRKWFAINWCPLGFFHLLTANA